MQDSMLLFLQAAHLQMHGLVIPVDFSQFMSVTTGRKHSRLEVCQMSLTQGCLMVFYPHKELLALGVARGC